MAPRESGRGGGSPLLEALPTENWPALGWLEGDRGLLAAAGTVGPGFHSGTNPRGRSHAWRGNPFGLADLATFRFVLEVFIVEEQLFPGCKDEVSAAVNTLQNLVLEFHGELLPSARDPKPMDKGQIATVSRSELSVLAASHQFHCSGTSPVGSARHAQAQAHGYCCKTAVQPDESSQPGIGKTKGRHGNRRPDRQLVLLFTCLLAAALARQRFFHTLSFARLEVEGVTLHFLDDVLLLDLSLKTPQGVF